MIRILVIVPYKDLLPAFQRELHRIEIKEVEFTTVHIYGSQAREIEDVAAYDIVIARGITSYAISSRFPDLNKIEIVMTSTDVLAAIKEVKQLYGQRKLGILLTDTSIVDKDVIKELTGFDVECMSVKGDEDVSSNTEILRQKGCEVFIGGLTLKRYCTSHNLKFVQIKTGLEAIRKCIRDALTAAHILEHERTRSSLLRVIVDYAHYCIVAVNAFSNIIVTNQQAVAFFDEGPLLGLPLTSILPESNMWLNLANSGKFEIVNTIKGHTVLITCTPIKVDNSGLGYMIALQKVDDIYATEHLIRSQLSRKGLTARYYFSDIVAETLIMKQLIAKAIRYAQVEENVLLTGETGTGKELFVQSMHNASSRSNGPFVAINCAALSEQLLESELFGYAEGAFTGASKGGKQGLFELAHGGSIFLDEIGEMPISLQAKLLRVLQEKEIRRVGGSEYIPVDVRVMSATNQNIPELIGKGLFRKDLYYRINLLTLHIPPLRERSGDIPLIFYHFVKKKAERMGIPAPNMDSHVSRILSSSSWDGNIRELRNAAERCVILNGSNTITKETLEVLDLPLVPVTAIEPKEKEVSVKHISNEELWQRYNASSLSLTQFAQSVGLSRTTLWRRFKEMGVETLK